MDTYVVNLEVPAASNAPIAAINVPASASASAAILCVENVNVEQIARASFRLRRYDSPVTGGDVVPFEPGTDTDRVERRHSFADEPQFEVRTGSFTVPGSGRKLSEQFTLRSLSGEDSECQDIEHGPIIVRPGESAVLVLVEAETDPVFVALEIQEIDLEVAFELQADFTRLFGEAFSGSGSLSTASWSTTATGSGTATLGGGTLTLATGATANSTIRAESAIRTRYLTGAVHHWLAVLRVPDAGSANNVRRWGPFDANNGYAFELDGTTLCLIQRKAGVDTPLASSDWDAPFVLDNEFHRWEILYRGNRVEILVDGVRRHLLTGNTTSPRIEDRDLPLRFESINSGGLASNLTLECIETAAIRHGPRSGAGEYIHMPAGSGTTTAKSGAGTLLRVLVNGTGIGGSTVTIYDNTSASGTVVAVLNSDAQGSYIYEIEFSTGLTIDKTVNSPDITVIFD